ncbi:sulfite exporter TauE/SafE family protein [Acidocella aminolytica]|jgi:uncharacterized membrane protein YfcA|uniref:Probable membrane transporter protein n=1 Tax=Acidocella aminolytica 101 = DSM 11237 TaxID=1120923 RepID=A0A0D6PIT8_9PROT|nr:sulfite exporter TauE/SafE family protein [Acidocella aminolytica]GAN80734.1 hypothetical protein Aam_055_114 [Acidocella aminolytica 101 = DSM 11237]GBQ37627.1 hypothetical protein AA11237_1602 [Acidocella aminolytica 101 = DSM 11237]SHE52716.1 hypothetical protein SAMN02746095_00670 [Acidocella aminolytica 101 = DSM 11237]
MSIFTLSHGLLWPTLHTLSAQGWLIVIGALLLGGLVKGVVSIGVPLVAIPLLTGLLTVKQVVLLLSMPIILGNIPQALEGGKTWPALKSIGFLVIGAVVGIALGVKILFMIPAHLAVGLAGCILLVAAITLLAAPKFTLPKKYAASMGLLAGFISGLMEGVSAIPGPLLATYLIATGATGKRFTKEIALVLVISVAVLIAMFGQSRHANETDLLISALAAVPVIAGIVAGRPLRDALPPKLFRALVLLFIIVAAVQMLRRSGLLGI